MKYRIVWIVGNGLLGRQAQYDTCVVEEIDVHSIHPAPDPATLYDTPELAQAAATPDKLIAFMRTELTRLEGTESYREHRGLREYHSFLLANTLDEPQAQAAPTVDPIPAADFAYSSASVLESH